MISGKAFADRCAWVHDPRYPTRREFYPSIAKHGDWVFVNGDYLHTFLRKMPVLHVKKFQLIVHNSDQPFGDNELRMLAPHALHIYAVNAIVQHPLLTPIPLGFRDCSLEFLQSYTPEVIPRTIEVYGNFKVCNNAPKRTACMNAFATNPHVVWRQETDFPSYLHDLCQSKFVLCPDGAGLDTHRLYEALLCGATPVVLRNSLTPLYRTLPVCIVDAWTDPFHVATQPPARFDVGSFLKG
jgi:hypothetical protein